MRLLSSGYAGSGIDPVAMHELGWGTGPTCSCSSAVVAAAMH